MNKLTALAAVLATTALIAGCHKHTHVQTGAGGIEFDDSGLALHADGAPEAHLTSDGTFTIGNSPVEVTAEQRAALVGFYGAAHGIIEHGIATGKAGAAVGVAAASEVLDGLAKGDTSQIGAKVEAKADAVRQAASKICDDLAAVRQAQVAAATALAAFKPYGTVSEADISDCVRGTSKKASAN